MNTKLAIVLLYCVASIAPATAQTVANIYSSGDPANRIDLLIVAEGYTSSESTKFAADATALVNGFLKGEIFDDYKSYFNVWSLFTPSIESGASHREVTPAVVKNTAFGAYYGCNGIARLICVDFTAVFRAASAALPSAQRDYVLVLVNDATYGGTGGGILVSSTHPSSVEIVAHEFGHSHGLLADEYADDPQAACVLAEPTAANATTQTDVNLVKWKHWIDAATPIPTLGTQMGVPGLYQGADYCATGKYRPTFSSKMRTLGNPYEQVNDEQMVRRLYTQISPIESVTPTALSLTTPVGAQTSFSVTPMQPLQHSLSVNWSVDAVAASTQNQFTLHSGTLSIGSHIVKVTAQDNSIWVRSDPDSFTKQTRSWTVLVVSGTGVGTTTTLTAPSQANFNESTLLSATVAGTSGLPTPTGTVEFRDGAVSVGTSELNATGLATLNAFLLLGDRSITALYAGDSTFRDSISSASQVSVLPPNFTLAASPESVSVQAGKSAQIALTVAPLGTAHQNVSLKCTAQPIYTSCSFNPSSVTLDGAAASATLTISTIASTAVASDRSTRDGADASYALLSFVPLLRLFRSTRARRFLRRHAQSLRFCAVLALAFLALNCGGGGDQSGSRLAPTPTPAPVPIPGTPLGASTVTVTATSLIVPPTIHSINIPLTVTP